VLRINQGLLLNIVIRGCGSGMARPDHPRMQEKGAECGYRKIARNSGQSVLVLIVTQQCIATQQCILSSEWGDSR
jgi:hypothetical protein